MKQENRKVTKLYRVKVINENKYYKWNTGNN
jgi:hypothetical protein